MAKYFYNFGMQEVELIDEATGVAPIGIDWQYKLGDDGEILINIANLDYGSTKNISAYYNGEKLCYMTDMISGEKGIDTIKAVGFEPQLLSYSPVVFGIENLHVSGNKLVWDFIDPKVTDTTVYKVNPNGSVNIAGRVNKNSFSYTENGCYIVKQTADKGRGKMITTDSEGMFKAQISNVKLLNSSVTCKVTVENISDIFASGEFFIGTKDINGEFSEKGIYNMSLKPGEVKEFTLRMPKDTNACTLSAELGGSVLCEVVLD